MLPLPAPPNSEKPGDLARNLRVVAAFERERFTGLSGSTIRLSAPAVDGLEMVTKNGAVLGPGIGAAGYTIDGAVITLNTPAIGADVFLIWYHTRGAT